MRKLYLMLSLFVSAVSLKGMLVVVDVGSDAIIAQVIARSAKATLKKNVVSFEGASLEMQDFTILRFLIYDAQKNQSVASKKAYWEIDVAQNKATSLSEKAFAESSKKAAEDAIVNSFLK